MSISKVQREIMKPSICYMRGINTRQNPELLKVETCEECVCSSLLPLISNLLILSLWNDAHMHVTKPPPPWSTPTSPQPLSLPERLVVTTGKVTRSSGRVQTETREPLALFSASKPTHENLPWFPLDMGSTWELKAPGMAVVIPSPVPRALCLIKWASVSTFDIGLTYV